MPAAPLLDDRLLDTCRRLVYRELGIAIDDAKRERFAQRVAARMSAAGTRDLAAYVNLLQRAPGGAEWTALVDSLTVWETFFWRTQKQLEWFGGPFLDRLTKAARRGERPRRLKVWSAACSTGEELYSLALVLAEQGLRLGEWRVELVGTDVSAGALAAAEAGVYGERAVERLSPERRRRHFQKLPDGRYRIKPHLRAHVRLRRHNLVDPPFEEGFDCVFLRNVMIYFDRSSKQRVVAHLFRALAPGGFLVIGPNEGVFDLLDGLNRHGPLLYEKPPA